KIILQDRDVASLSSFIGVDGINTTPNSGRIQINLKSRAQRRQTASEIIRRLQPKLAQVMGITLYMQPVQDLTVEDRVSRTQLNQYHVVLEVDPQFQQTPDSLKDIYVKSSSGTQVPLSAFSHFEQTSTSLAINHQGQFPVVTLSFNLAPGVSLGEATQAMEN